MMNGVLSLQSAFSTSFSSSFTWRGSAFLTLITFHSHDAPFFFLSFSFFRFFSLLFFVLPFFQIPAKLRHSSALLWNERFTIIGKG